MYTLDRIKGVGCMHGGACGMVARWPYLASDVADLIECADEVDDDHTDMRDAKRCDQVRVAQPLPGASKRPCLVQHVRADRSSLGRRGAAKYVVGGATQRLLCEHLEWAARVCDARV